MALPPGVPNLLGDVAGLFQDFGEILYADSYIGYGAGAPPQWGLFLGGSPVVVADTITEMGYKQDWAIADYPVERGGFESYDKVNIPFRAVFQFVSGGSDAKRQALLDSIAAIGDTLTLYDVLTPEAVYVGVNVEHYDYRRASSNGLGLMIVNVGVLEIREEGKTDFKNAKPPSAYAPEQRGNVQSPEATTPAPSGVQ
jgi:hypothetical protein